MRRNLVTSRGSQPHCEQSLLVWITSQHRQFRPGGNPGGASPHFKSAGLRTTCCSLVADSADFLDASFFCAATATREKAPIVQVQVSLGRLWSQSPGLLDKDAELLQSAARLFPVRRRQPCRSD